MPIPQLRLRPPSPDIIAMAALAVCAAVASYVGAQRIDPLLFNPLAAGVWFQSDLPQIYDHMITRGGDHHLTSAHPLFSLVAVPPTGLLYKFFGMERVEAVRVVMALVTAAWVGVLFALLRTMGCRTLDAVLFTLLGVMSAAAVFWSVVPQPYSLGSASILLALLVVALAERRALSEAWYVTISAATCSFTTTNWIAGIAAAFGNLRWKRAVQVTVTAFFIVIMLWWVQKLLIPGARFFLGVSAEEPRFGPDADGALSVLASAVLHSMVMPAWETVDRVNPPGWQIMSIVYSLPWSGGPWGAAAVALWVILLGFGLWGFYSHSADHRFRLVLGIILVGQLIFPLFHNQEPFSYSLHVLPLLLLLAAFSALSRYRWLVLPTGGALLLCAAVNNLSQFDEATGFLSGDHIESRSAVLRQMLARPADPWPRGQGHIILAQPGSVDRAKSYHEPGGSFSPSVASFGISVWVKDSGDVIKLTSDDMPYAMLRQQLDWGEGNVMRIPAIATDTPFFRTHWSLTATGDARLDLTQPEYVNKRLAIAIRSVGPAGAPIRALDWDTRRLIVNDRWSVTIEPPPIAVYVGEEGQPGWKSHPPSSQRWRGESGWGYARIDLGGHKRWTLHITDTFAEARSSALALTGRSALKLDLPDPRFADSLDAQMAHLLMSLVDGETRSADPTNTPIPWLRTGTYIIVALVRAGHLEVAKELSRYLAENDFYGGFGPEADGPGLALWALKEVASELDDSEYERWLWPHVRRKAEFILRMLSTTTPIRISPKQSIVPRLRHHPDSDLVCEPTRDGLIVGRMDYHRPLLYVNAMSYHGLAAAARFADRGNHHLEASRWRTAATRLRRAWEDAFRAPETLNDRTYISALWPSWIGTRTINTFSDLLQMRWTRRRGPNGDFRKVPKWTYFELAEAHQWLFLGNQEKVWSTLRWFWDHQASPGLYTWWEDEGEGNPYHGWNRVRGWVNPPHVTPHYWTAAEMALLQLDMLAYVDESGSEPTLVVGGGIPTDWLAHSMRVEGVRTSLGQVSWSWSEGKMQVTVQTRERDVNLRLGQAFPADTAISLHVLPRI